MAQVGNFGPRILALGANVSECAAVELCRNAFAIKILRLLVKSGCFESPNTGLFLLPSYC
jgi:hypothetical protein